MDSKGGLSVQTAYFYTQFLGWPINTNCLFQRPTHQAWRPTLLVFIVSNQRGSYIRGLAFPALIPEGQGVKCDDEWLELKNIPWEFSSKCLGLSAFKNRCVFTRCFGVSCHTIKVEEWALLGYNLGRNYLPFPVGQCVGEFVCVHRATVAGVLLTS